ncbi:MAG TPA: zinc-binding dehydrogenase [Xanthobacteraceae bacterium]|nr:zinc-binding dehydrogenase [Xanthobacteraceae bacterium]
MKAVEVNGDHRLVLADAKMPEPQRNEALVRVHAISLNRGEVRRAASAAAGFRPGWDFAGVVEAPAGDGSGPKAGTRVVGLMPVGAWAEMLAARTDMIAPLPDGVSFAQAACLPVAGLTALHALARRGDLIARKVLITGASGGVGHFACQLAKIAGAQVIAAIRSDAHVGFARALGVDDVAVVGDEPARAASLGPYDLILESIGGASLAASAKMLAPDGVCVAFGVSAGPQATIDIAPLYFTGRASIYGLGLFHELARREPANVGLERLLSLLSRGRLKVHVAVEEPWEAIDEVARDLIARRYLGKAVLTVK